VKNVDREYIGVQYITERLVIYGGDGLPRTGGKETRRRILDAAENLFSQSGFDGTSIDRIARVAGVNKATIYYHFRDKAELMETLFRNIVDEVETAARESGNIREGASPGASDDETEAIRRELDFLAGKRKILVILFTEALKEGSDGSVLFRCAEKVLRREHPDLDDLTKEFFTGFVPLFVFVLMRGKFARHFGIRDEDLSDGFLEAFRESHLEGRT